MHKIQYKNKTNSSSRYLPVFRMIRNSTSGTCLPIPTWSKPFQAGHLTSRDDCLKQPAKQQPAPLSISASGAAPAQHMRHWKSGHLHRSWHLFLVSGNKLFIPLLEWKGSAVCRDVELSIYFLGFRKRPKHSSPSHQSALNAHPDNAKYYTSCHYASAPVMTRPLEVSVGESRREDNAQVSKTYHKLSKMLRCYFPCYR